MRLNESEKPNPPPRPGQRRVSCRYLNTCNHWVRKECDETTTENSLLSRVLCHTHHPSTPFQVKTPTRQKKSERSHSIIRHFVISIRSRKIIHMHHQTLSKKPVLTISIHLVQFPCRKYDPDAGLMLRRKYVGVFVDWGYRWVLCIKHVQRKHQM